MFFLAFSQPSILSVGGPPGERVSTGKTTVLEQKLTRVQRKSTKKANSAIYTLWTEYEEGERSARSLLEAGSRLICPSGHL